MGKKEEWLMLKWVVLVKMGMVFWRRPALAAGRAVSRATLRQGQLRKTTAWFARICFGPEFLVSEAHEGLSVT